MGGYGMSPISADASAATAVWWLWNGVSRWVDTAVMAVCRILPAPADGFIQPEQFYGLSSITNLQASHFLCDSFNLFNGMLHLGH